MSEVAIKFWDVKNKKYICNTEDLFLNPDNTVGTFRSKIGIQESRKDLEPHFYKDGERIDE